MPQAEQPLQTKTHKIRVTSTREFASPRSRILDGDGATYALAAIRDLLWIDAFRNGPWTPSYITRVTLERPDGSITYERADDGG